MYPHGALWELEEKVVISLTRLQVPFAVGESFPTKQFATYCNSLCVLTLPALLGGSDASFWFEQEEDLSSSSKPLPYLRYKSHDPKPTGPVGGGPFGSEPAEQSGAKASVPKRTRLATPTNAPGPFQDEVDEVQNNPGFQFGGEPSPRAPRLFGEEPGEHSEDEESLAGSSSSERSETAFQLRTTKTVFALGWHTIMDMKKGSFWKKHLDERQEAKKRRYNNSGRATTAAYARQKSKGAYEENGTDPSRLQKLFAAPQCMCALHVNWLCTIESNFFDALESIHVNKLYN